MYSLTLTFNIIYHKYTCRVNLSWTYNINTHVTQIFKHMFFVCLWYRTCIVFVSHCISNKNIFWFYVPVWLFFCVLFRASGILFFRTTLASSMFKNFCIKTQFIFFQGRGELTYTYNKRYIIAGIFYRNMKETSTRMLPYSVQSTDQIH